MTNEEIIDSARALGIDVDSCKSCRDRIAHPGRGSHYGHISAENRQTQATFKCVECGFAENADVVGAINVLRAGHARLACEVSGAIMPPAAGTHRSEYGASA